MNTKPRPKPGTIGHLVSAVLDEMNVEERASAVLDLIGNLVIIDGQCARHDIGQIDALELLDSVSRAVERALFLTRLKADKMTAAEASS